MVNFNSNGSTPDVVSRMVEGLTLRTELSTHEEGVNTKEQVKKALDLALTNQGIVFDTDTLGLLHAFCDAASEEVYKLGIERGRTNERADIAGRLALTLANNTEAMK